MKVRLAFLCVAAAGMFLPAANSSAAPKAKTEAPAQTPPAAQPDPNADYAYAAYQRGYYQYAFNEAKRRADLANAQTKFAAQLQRYRMLRAKYQGSDSTARQ